MNETQKQSEERLRSEAAEAFRYTKPTAAKSSSFTSFEITPEETRAAAEKRDALEDDAKRRF